MFLYMFKKISKKDEITDFVMYATPDVDVNIEACLREENIWFTQVKMADLFGVQRLAITKHLKKNLRASGELDKKDVSSILEHNTKKGTIEGNRQYF